MKRSFLLFLAFVAVFPLPGEAVRPLGISAKIIGDGVVRVNDPFQYVTVLSNPFAEELTLRVLFATRAPGEQSVKAHVSAVRVPPGGKRFLAETVAPSGTALPGQLGFTAVLVTLNNLPITTALHQFRAVSDAYLPAHFYKTANFVFSTPSHECYISASLVVNILPLGVIDAFIDSTCQGDICPDVCGHREIYGFWEALAWGKELFLHLSSHPDPRYPGMILFSRAKPDETCQWEMSWDELGYLLEGYY